MRSHEASFKQKNFFYDFLYIPCSFIKKQNFWILKMKIVSLKDFLIVFSHARKMFI